MKQLAWQNYIKKVLILTRYLQLEYLFILIFHLTQAAQLLKRLPNGPIHQPLWIHALINTKRVTFKALLTPVKCFLQNQPVILIQIATMCTIHRFASKEQNGLRLDTYHQQLLDGMMLMMNLREQHRHLEYSHQQMNGILNLIRCPLIRSC